MEEFGEEEGTEAVSGHLQFEPLRKTASQSCKSLSTELIQYGTDLSALAPFWWPHDPGIVPQHIQSGLLAQELVRTCLDGCQVGQIQVQEDHPALGIGQ